MSISPEFNHMNDHVIKYYEEMEEMYRAHPMCYWHAEEALEAAEREYDDARISEIPMATIDFSEYYTKGVVKWEVNCRDYAKPGLELPEEGVDIDDFSDYDLVAESGGFAPHHEMTPEERKDFLNATDYCVGFEK